MCGIVAIVRRRTSRTKPDSAKLISMVDAAIDRFPASSETDIASVLALVASDVASVNDALKGEAGLQAMLTDPGLVKSLETAVKTLDEKTANIEQHLETQGVAVPDLEQVNAVLVELKDATWGIGRDRLRAANEVVDLANSGQPELASSPTAVAILFSIQQTLSNIDRLEVRGRDSAGIQVLVRNHGLDLESASVKALMADRLDNPLFVDCSINTPDGNLSFVYKAAAEIGELGDNTEAMRVGIRSDALLHMAISGDEAEATVLAHTRWASVGSISEPNAHPVNSDELDGIARPYVAGVLNGDVDNFADLIANEGLQIPPEITTDAKVIPSLISRSLSTGLDIDEAVRSSVAQFEGSVAIGVSSSSNPADLHLTLRGSGQSVYVGLAEDAFIVASEPYGVVEDSEAYIRMDGETPSDPNNPSASQGQIIRLDGAFAGMRQGASRMSYDGTSLPISEDEWKVPEVTTRDIDRGNNPHFLLKEINESPTSFRKTLRGRLVEEQGELNVELPENTIPAELRQRIQAGGIRNIEITGQGTAAVAGQAMAALLENMVGESAVRVRAITATELCGFQLRDDMENTLVVAISQSGTTTDTNRAVDLVRSRGAIVVAIVNRRGSDLTDKADGVLYTSDGRDVEMSVASTKAFYAQIAAGQLLSEKLVDLLPDVSVDPTVRQQRLVGLRDLPEAMDATLLKRSAVADAASRNAPSRRYWAMVGNGLNHIAARELRIKLSELCYKSIACDITEDKKHIDLSSEPLILICAAGLVGSTADDVAKEVAIFGAHKATPIVIATEGENRFNGATEVITVPDVHPSFAFVLSTVIGHLFGYEAALAIDSSARPLREIRGVIETYVGAEDEQWFANFGAEIKPQTKQFFEGLRAGHYNGHLEAGTSVRVAALLRFATGSVRLDAYQVEFGKVGTPGQIVEDLAAGLTTAIEELTRPIDAIKHQAKTVTVGISRTDESLLQAALIQSVLDTGCPRDRLSYRSLRTLAALTPAVDELVGFTRYIIDGEDLEEGGQIRVRDKGGIAANITSRVDTDPTLRGTKHRVAVEQLPFVTVGSDGRVVLIVPEVKAKKTTGLTLCHLRLEESLDAKTARTVLQGYRDRYRQLSDFVTEVKPSLREDLLAEVPTVELLTAPISSVGSYWVE